MKLLICAVGRLKAGPERELCERYRKRAEELSARIGLSGPTLAEIPESRARDEASRCREEWAALAAKSEGAVRLALDERGASCDSAAFADRLFRRREAGVKALAFLIGGADGLAPEARQASAEIISFGAMTLPHQFVRILALEQIYRAFTILRGYPYAK